MTNWSEILISHFGEYESREKLEVWEVTKSLLSKDENIKGEVIFIAPYGVWLDINMNFPALIETIVLSEDLNEYVVGTFIDAKVSGIRDAKRQIYLHQKEWPFKINDTL
jgi:ribosomal protein S1